MKEETIPACDHSMREWKNKKADRTANRDDCSQFPSPRSSDAQGAKMREASEGNAALAFRFGGLDWDWIDWWLVESSVGGLGLDVVVDPESGLDVVVGVP